LSYVPTSFTVRFFNLLAPACQTVIPVSSRLHFTTRSTERDLLNLDNQKRSARRYLWLSQSKSLFRYFLSVPATR